jgi:hypothetical protein
MSDLPINSVWATIGLPKAVEPKYSPALLIQPDEVARRKKGPAFWFAYYPGWTFANSCYCTGVVCGMTRQYLPILVFSGLTAASLGGLLLLPALPQDQSYHLFADCRTVAGIPNFWNVASNTPFIAVGAAGLWRFRDGPATIILFLGFFLTSIRSSYYHWDR